MIMQCVDGAARDGSACRKIKADVIRTGISIRIPKDAYSSRAQRVHGGVQYELLYTIDLVIREVVQVGDATRDNAT